jgi:hypothetical protein
LVVLAWLFVLAVLLQFFFAGLGLLGGESMSLHKDFGWMPVHSFPVLLLIAAFFAKAGRTNLILCLVLVILTGVQPIWVTEFRGEFLGSMHILGAAAILGLAHAIAQRANRLGNAGALAP